MKTSFALAALMIALTELDKLLDSMNQYVELGIKVAGLAATMGAAWRWVIGPGYRRARSVVVWVGEQLRLISTLDERLDSMEADLTRGSEHFARLDAALEALAAEDAVAVRRAIHTGDPVELLPDGSVERRGSPAPPPTPTD
jgi:hypothetical protein